jgi:hypothetical protein
MLKYNRAGRDMGTMFNDAPWLILLNELGSAAEEINTFCFNKKFHPGLVYLHGIGSRLVQHGHIK